VKLLLVSCHLVSSYGFKLQIPKRPKLGGTMLAVHFKLGLGGFTGENKSSIQLSSIKQRVSGIQPQSSVIQNLISNL
jgi:hypothetical protein